MTLLSRVNFNKTSPSGFTLIEMAVVMMISGIIIATMITLLPTFVKSDKIKENRTRMTKYDNALQGYIITHFRLPLADIDGDGFEEDGTADEDAFGYLPYRTLGLHSGDDAWGHPVRYVPQEWTGDTDDDDYLATNLTKTTSKEDFCSAAAFTSFNIGDENATNEPTLTTNIDDFCDLIGDLILMAFMDDFLSSSYPYNRSYFNTEHLYTTSEPEDGGVCNSGKNDSAEAQAYVIVSGGPEDLDKTNGGFFDSCNGTATGWMSKVGFNNEDKTWTADYDDTVRSFSVFELYHLVCSQ